MSDYILRFTDPANGAVVVKPFTSNGPDTPASEIPLDSSAAAANTSLVLMGKGLPDYGDRIQENLLHLLEHCSYKSRPANPVQGQLWYKNGDYIDTVNPTDPVTAGLFVYNGSTWDNVIVSSTVSGDLDLSGFKVVNLGTPTDPTDAVNMQYANDTYVALAGGTMTGALSTTSLTVTAGTLDMSSFRIIQLSDPIADDDAVTKQYVDLAIFDATGSSSYLPLAGGTMIGPIIMSSAQLNMYDAPFTADNSPMALTDSTLTLIGDSRLDFQGSRVIMNQHQIEQLPLVPIYATDAASKGYVDDTIAAAIYHDRDILVGDGVTTTFQLNTTYVVGSHDLCVFDNGVKQYASQTAEVDIVIESSTADTPGYQTISSPTSVYTDIALLNADTYVFSAVVDDITYANYTIEVFAPTTFADVATELSSALSASATVHWNNDTHSFVIVSNTTGTASNARFMYPNDEYALDLFNVIMTDTLIQLDFAVPVVGTSGDISPTTAVTLPLAAYSFDLNVDGTNYPVTITVTSPLLTITDILSLVRAAAVSAPVYISFRDGTFMFKTLTPGNLGTVNISADTFFAAVATGLGTISSIVNKGSRVAVSTVTTGTSEFSVVGNYTTSFTTNALFVVSGSTGNDGVYTVSIPSTYGAGETTITVVETIADAATDGTIYFARDFAYTETGNPSTVSDTIEFNVAPDSTDTIEVIVSKKTPL